MATHAVVQSEPVIPPRPRRNICREHGYPVASGTVWCWYCVDEETHPVSLHWESRKYVRTEANVEW
jgi:hypothetical protein